MAGKTLEELENSVWGEPEFHSGLVDSCHRLRKKPLEDFTVEDFRLMICQQTGLEYLVPRAVAILEADPLAEGSYYPGDLLASVIAVATWLQAHPELVVRVVEVVDRAVVKLAGKDEELLRRLLSFKEHIRP